MTEPVRMLHVFATLGRGGPQIRAMQLLARLGHGYAHTFVAMDGRHDALELLPRDVVHDVVAVQRLPFVASVRRFAGLLRQRRPNLLLTYNWGAIEAVAAGWWTGVCPIVHHEDGFGPEEQVQRLSRRSWLRRWLLRRTAAVVVPSHNLLAIAQREWHLAERVHCLPNGVDLQRFAPAANRATGDAPLTLGSVGGLRAEKDHATLLRAVAAMRERVRVLLVGDGPERPRLEALTQELGIAERVTFAGASSDPAPHYRAMDVFVLSSRTEQMPLSLLEAMASGLPCAATAVGDVARILPEGSRAALVPPGDPAALAGALDALCSDVARRRAEGQRNRAHAEQHYELGGCLDRFLAIYRSALSR